MARLAVTVPSKINYNKYQIIDSTGFRAVQDAVRAVIRDRFLAAFGRSLASAEAEWLALVAGR